MEICSIGSALEIDNMLQTRFYSLTESIARFDQPIIAATNGDAIGQELELALACDMRTASETSSYGMSHIRSGLIPWDWRTQRVTLGTKGKGLGDLET